jgi:predicted P-loop ATPase
MSADGSSPQRKPTPEERIRELEELSTRVREEIAESQRLRTATRIDDPQPEPEKPEPEPPDGDPSPPPSTSGGEGWQADLIVSEKTKTIKPSIANVMHAMRECPCFKGTLRFDRFALRTAVVKHLPWDDNDVEHKVRFWGDNDDTKCTEWMHRNGIMGKLIEMGIAALAVARENPFHPLHDDLYRCNREYQALCAREPDAGDKLDPLNSGKLPELFGVDPTPYTIAAFKCMMVSAVARALKPGCKVDTMLVIEGGQGKGKSKGIRALFGDAYFSDCLSQMGSKDSVQQLFGKWCVEVAELVALLAGNAEDIKAFITCQSDYVRLPYMRAPDNYPRSSIFIGTTNNDDWARDVTGNRRFWPVKATKDIQADEIGELRNLLWGQAVDLFMSREKWWFEDAAVIAEATEQQEARTVRHEWTMSVLAMTARMRVDSKVILETLTDALIKEDPGKNRPHANRTVGSILTKEGWTRGPRERLGPLGPDGKHMKVSVFHQPTKEDDGQEEMPFG